MSRFRIALVSAATAVVVAGGISLAAVISSREPEPGMTSSARRSRQCRPRPPRRIGNGPTH